MSQQQEPQPAPPAGCKACAQAGPRFFPLAHTRQRGLRAPQNCSLGWMQLLCSEGILAHVSGSPLRAKQPPPALLPTFITARCKSSCSGLAPRDQHVFKNFTLLPDSVFQYFALNLLLYLISLQQLFSTLTTNHKSIRLCVRDCLCPRMPVSEKPRGRAAGYKLHRNMG